ncbi:putative ABC transport system permease protein [Kribbella sp. VKM Ac-2569]|uniref:ABC transporter permease n=1 Tax=Kribbella sp. VKM Ac-2569 TaxID=2512220 RepID=UPI00102B0805|nr:FtsX-like permease family protein [Kribbella sp. VKM Ac-2569]RZT19514.1 putative ABC transport system permease protein [Kribbella sp. VKM Ac-2569]
MFRLAVTTLRYRTAAFLAIFVAVVLGGALLSAAGGLLETGLRLNAPPQRLSAAPIVVTGDPAYHPPNGSGSAAFPERHRVDPALLTKLTTTPGVAKAVPDRSFPAVITSRGTSGTTLAGHGWTSAALTPYQLTAGHAPRSGQVVLDQRLAGTAKPGDRVTVTVSGTPRTYTLAGIAVAQHQVDVPPVFFADADVPEGLDAIGVFPADGTSVRDLAKRLDLPTGVKAFTGDERGVAEFSGIATGLPLIIMSGVFGGMVAVVMALVVSATIGLSVRQRRRELALLRASGATPRQVAKMVIAETMVVGLIGLVLGLLCGRIAGTWIFGMLADGGIVPSQLRLDQGPLPFAGAAVLTFAVLRVTVGFAAGRAARIRPIQALAEAAVPQVALSRVRILIGLVFAGATAAIALSTPFMGPANAAAIGGPAGLTGSIAVAVLAPLVIQRALIPRITRLVEKRGTSGTLAVINLRVRAVQFGAILIPITIATAIALGNIYSQTTQQQAAVDAFTKNLSGDVVITSTAGGIPASLTDSARSMPGVTAVSEVVRSKGWIEEPYDKSHTSDAWPLLGLSGPVYTGKVKKGSLDDLTGDTVALPPGTAKKLKVGVGSEIGLRLGDNALVKVKVVALAEGPSGYESLLLPAQLLAAHTTSGLPSQLLLKTDNKLHPDLSKWPGTTIGGRELLSEGLDTGLGVDAWIGYLLAAIAVAYTAIASINTIAVAVLDRRREFGLQRLTGSTRREVSRMLRLEGVLIAALGLVAGLVTAAFTVFPIALATRGWPIPSGPVWIVLIWVAVVLLLVLPTTAITGRIAMRSKPMDALASPVG